jgi:hypothetical protein
VDPAFDLGNRVARQFDSSAKLVCKSGLYSTYRDHCVARSVGCRNYFCLGITGQFSLIGVASSAEFSCCIVCAIAVFVGIWFERVPFDVIEAESELIDGVTTELGGVVFSMIYACEVVAMLYMLKLFSVIPGITGVVLGTFILLTFVGRIFLARLLLGHVLTLLFTIALGLMQPAFWLLKISLWTGHFYETAYESNYGKWLWVDILFRVILPYTILVSIGAFRNAEIDRVSRSSRGDRRLTCCIASSAMRIHGN